jgi:isoleucyl-tRNA synthetase
MAAAVPVPMLATLAGCLALALGVAVLLLPLLVSELSRPRDAGWGAVVLLLGLVLVTGADRLTGAPMLAVLCGGLLIGRLGVEVGQGRWRQLTPEEQQRLGSRERWRNGLGQLGASLVALAGTAMARLGALGSGLGSLGSGLGSLGGGLAGGLGGANGEGRSRRGGKRWVRPEASSEPSSTHEPAEPSGEAEARDQAENAGAGDVVVVSSFADIDEHLALATPSAAPEGGGPDEAG